MDKLEEKLDYLIKKIDNLESRINNLEDNLKAQNSSVAQKCDNRQMNFALNRETTGEIAKSNVNIENSTKNSFAYKQEQSIDNNKAATTAKKSYKMKETQIGKNILSILAALLVLVGVAILIASVWNLLEDVFKFAIIFAVGVILQVVGTYVYLKKDLKTSGITLVASGQGIIQLVIIGGCVGWRLYSVYIGAVLFMLWSAEVLWYSIRFKETIFYAINLIGSTISIGILTIAFENEGPSLFVLLFTLVISVVNYFAIRFNKKVCGILYSIFIVLSVVMVYGWMTFGVTLPRINSIMGIVLVLGMAVFSYFQLQSRLSTENKNDVVIVGFSAFVHIALLNFVLATENIEKNLNLIMPEGIQIAFGIFVVVFSIALILINKSKFYLKMLCITPILFVKILWFNAQEVGGIHWASVLTVNLIALLVTIDLFKIEDNLKIVCEYAWAGINIFSYGLVYSVSWDVDYTVSLEAILLYLSSMVVPILLYASAFMEGKKTGKLSVGKYVIALISISIFTIKLGYLHDLRESIAIFLLILVIAPYYLNKKYNTKELNIIHSIYTLFISFILYVICLLDMMVTNSLASEVVRNVETTAAIFDLLMLASLNIYKAVALNSKLSFLAFLYTAINFQAIMQFARLGEYAVITSIIMLGIAALSIFFGVRLKNKSLRLFGLIFSILIVIKMVIFDIRIDSIFIRVFAFIVGGAICFGLSVLYGKLENLYSEETQVEDNKEK